MVHFFRNEERVKSNYDTGKKEWICLFVDLSKDPIKGRLIFRSYNIIRGSIQNLLRIPEKSVFFFANLDGTATELYNKISLELKPNHALPTQQYRGEGVKKEKKRTYLGNQDLITARDAHGNLISISVKAARANGKNGGLVDVLDGALGQENAAGGLGFGLDALNQNTVQKGNEVLDVAKSLEGGEKQDC